MGRIGKEMDYNVFTRKMVQLCEKACQKKKVGTQTEGSFFEKCWEMERMNNQELTSAEFLQFTVDSLHEKAEQEQDSKKDPEKEQPPWSS